MAVQATQAAQAGDFADTLAALVQAEGTAGHAHAGSDALTHGPEAARNVADVIHHLCLLHGRHPGILEYAAIRSTGPLQDLLIEASDAFGIERALLTRLVVAVGPLPSTPGQADAESAVLAQHHAIDMLGRSDRNGCAMGAAIALLLDWNALRPIIDEAARRLSVEAPRSMLPGDARILDAVRATAPSVPVERAMMFGAQQIVAQHRGLWALLEARAAARSDY